MIRLFTIIAFFINLSCNTKKGIENNFNLDKKPDKLPNIRLYSKDSPLNQKVGKNPEIDPDSSFFISHLFEVIKLPPQDPDFEDSLGLPDDGCAKFE